MFEVTGNDIQLLDDKQLRTLVARLCIAELRSKNLPVSGVTAGGDQNAPDGGLDVRVELSGEAFSGDFIPVVPLGFQVKKPDMGPAAIKQEMRPEGTLRSVIGELADAGGGYIIVSSNGSVADKPLQNRKAAIRGALGGHPSAARLTVDFYDRERLAGWVNCYPGVSAWVREKIGSPLSGWQALGDWSGTRVSGDGRFICDDTACLMDARGKEQSVLPMSEGITQLRATLAEPGQCVRVIGMSGLGKTRLVQALFESEIGSDPLDPSLAIYTDYSETPDPTARQLALGLVERGQRAIMVVDNCNPQTHSDLARICGSKASKVSLITVEYDVRDDEPERTEVFRLRSASSSTLVEWLKVTFPHVTQVDRDRIAEFSGGNFRVAGVLAETVKRGDTLGDLRDRELFARIFVQRNSDNEDLLNAAEALAIVYSFDGTDTSTEGELNALSTLTNVDTTKLYGYVAELKRRGIIQSRGRWRAVLPHAIANRLAAQALERIPPATFDSFCQDSNRRMQKSIGRRLGYLHDSQDAIAIVGRWLQADGPVGDLLCGDDDALQILRNIAPVAPEAVLAKIEQAIAGTGSPIIFDPRRTGRWQIAAILKSLAYDPQLFDRAAIALAKLVASEAANENRNSAKGLFEELFHLHLSGTQAPPAQRRRLVESLFARTDFDGKSCGEIAIAALLKSQMFSSTSNFDFGARSRDFGWHPPTHGDIWNWFSEAIDLAVKLGLEPTQRQAMRRTLGGALRGILGIEACLNSIEAAVAEFLKDGEWIEAWLTIRSAMRFDQAGWRPAVQQRVLSLEVQLRPTDPLNLARAYVIEARGSGSSLVDAEEDDTENPSAAWERLNVRAEELGQELGTLPDVLSSFLPEVMGERQAPRAFAFGRGLANSGADRSAVWDQLRRVLDGLPIGNRNASVMGGFISVTAKDESELAATLLEASMEDPAILPHFVYLQGVAGIDSAAIGRLRQLIRDQKLEAHHLYALANGYVASAPQSELCDLLRDIATLQHGTDIAIEILQMAIFCHKSDGVETDSRLFDVGHQLLMQADYSRDGGMREYHTQEAIKACYAGPQGEAGAAELCRHIFALIDNGTVYSFQLDHVIDALFEVQPTVTLDELLLTNIEDVDHPIFGDSPMSGQGPLGKVDDAVLWAWADVDPAVRYPILSRTLDLFAGERYGEDKGLSDTFVEAIERAPDRAAFLGSFDGRLSPSRWSGNLSAILDRRAEFLEPLLEHSDTAVVAWATEQRNKLATWAEHERQRESDTDESFE